MLWQHDTHNLFFHRHIHLNLLNRISLSGHTKIRFRLSSHKWSHNDVQQRIFKKNNLVSVWTQVDALIEGEENFFTRISNSSGDIWWTTPMRAIIEGRKAGKLCQRKEPRDGDRQPGQCRPVTWLYLYMHFLKYSTFSGISRRWSSMNFNYTWIM